MNLSRYKQTIRDLYDIESDNSVTCPDQNEGYRSTSVGTGQITEEQISWVNKQLEEYRRIIEQAYTSQISKPTSFKTTVHTMMLDEKSETEQSVVQPSTFEEQHNMQNYDKVKLLDDLNRRTIDYADHMMGDKSLDEHTIAAYKLEKGYAMASKLFEKLKSGISKCLIDYCANSADFLLEKHYLDYKQYRLERPTEELEILTKQDYQIRIEHEKRKRMKHRILINRLFNLNKDFRDFHENRSRALKKNALGVRMRMDVLRRREQDKLEMVEKERLEAIKSHKFEVYKDLLKKAKNRRILEILAETDMFLQEISKKVIESKGGTEVDIFELPINANGEYDVNKSALLQENYNKLYYNFTHTNQEEIITQPSLLKGGTLKSYQVAGLKWMISLYINKLNGILADEMGLGKTIQTIALFCYLIEYKYNYGPFLVIVPLSTLSNWKMEFEKWAPSIKKVIYKGNPQQRKEISRYLKTNKFNVCLTTYEFIMKDKSDLNKFHWQYIIVDEGHKMKNPKSKFAYTLGYHYNSEHRLLLTGTPLQNNLTELWSLLNFLLPKVFASAEDFDKWFKMPMKRLGAEKDFDLNEEEKLLLVHRFHQVLRPFLLRRVKKDVEHELPRKIEFIVKVELSQWQKVIYNQISQKESCNIMTNSGKVTSCMMNNIIMQLRKVCNHPYLFLDDYADTEELIRCSGKFELLDRMLPKLISTGHRMLMFTQMTTVINLLEVFCTLRNIRYLRLDGTTKHEERAERMLSFNAPNSDIPLFLLSTKAGGLGLNLQTADTVILFDSDWNPAIDEQAKDRAHRIGTLREVRIFRLVTQSTIEEQIITRASFKKGLDEMVIQAGLYNNKSTDAERRQRLEEIIKKQNLGNEDSEEIPNDEEINRIMARNDAEFEIFQENDRQRYEIEKKIYPNFSLDFNYRLVTYEEIPQWIREPEAYRKKDRLLTKRRRPNIWDLACLIDDKSLSFSDKRVKQDKSRDDNVSGSISSKKKGNIEEIFIDSDN